MKILDKFIVKTFIPPFILSFGVVMFVYTMQSMWKFIDDILGKGASVWMIIEFILYLSISLIALALPAAILLASIFIMGNLSERYELTSMKSAGVSLWRIMRPLIVTSMVIAVFSFICSNYIAPVANLKFKTRLYNFKSQKLALSLNEGIFNDDFRNFSIRIGEKDDATGSIKDIMLYDHSLENRNRTKIIMAKEGRMDMESDERYLIMHLDDGRQYQEMEESKTRKPKDPKRYPYLRIKFDNLEKYMSLSEFEMKDMKEELFKDQEGMLSARQLYFEIDTMKQNMVSKKEYLASVVSTYYHFVKTSDSTSYYVPMSQTLKRDKKQVESKYKERARGYTSEQSKKDSERWRNATPPKAQLERPRGSSNSKNPPSPPRPPTNNKFAKRKTDKKEEIIIRAKLLGTPATFEEILMPAHRKHMKERAATATKGVKDKAANHLGKISSLEVKMKRYIYQIHLKFSLAFACIIFLFIGAPLGAIIRKGGFGYPILFGVLLFVVFIALVTVFKKLGDNGSLTPAMAAWIPVVMYFVPCFFLTRGAVKDAKAMSLETMEKYLKGLTIFRKLMGG